MEGILRNVGMTVLAAAITGFFGAAFVKKSLYQWQSRASQWPVRIGLRRTGRSFNEEHVPWLLRADGG